MTFLEKLDLVMDDQRLNKHKLSQISGVPYTTIVGFYEKGYENAKISTLRKIAKALGVTLDFLIESSNEQENPLSKLEQDIIRKYRTLDKRGKDAVERFLDHEMDRLHEIADLKSKLVIPTEAEVIPIHIPLMRQPVSAGTGAYLGPEESDVISIERNDATARASFALRVRGDSMEPEYSDDDILLIEKAEEIKVDGIGVFTLDGEGYVKRRGQGELISLNPDYDPIPFDDSIRCNGRVIGKLDPSWIL